MRLLKTIFLLLIFCIDVHVKADEAAKAKDCWGVHLPCVVKVSDGRRVLKAEHLTVSMVAPSLLQQRDKKNIQFVTGDFYVETEEPVHFRAAYGEVWCEGKCKGLFARRTDDLNVRSLEGDWRLKRLGDPQIYSLPPGFQMDISEVTTDGVAQMGFPQSLPWLVTVKDWVDLYPGTLAELKPTLAGFRPVWKQAVEAASQMHLEAAKRELASHDKAVADAHAKELGRLQEQEKLRELFRQKNP